MQPRDLLASTVTPDGMRMTLSEHAGDYYIDVDGQALMSTRAPGSEDALGRLPARELAAHPRPRVLIGGLGLGFTLKAALETLPRAARVVVAEYFQIIVDWNRKFSFAAEADLLADPRVQVRVTDVADFVEKSGQTFDAILLDVDNGPDALCLETNDRLYDLPGLARLRRALHPGGLLAVWSSEASAVFLKRLVEAGFTARSETVRSRGRKGDRHTIFIARLA